MDLENEVDFGTDSSPPPNYKSVQPPSQQQQQQPLPGEPSLAETKDDADSEIGKFQHLQRMTPRVLKLYGLRDASLQEEEAKSIFDTYAKTSGDYLILFEVRQFLCDVQQSFAQPPFIPDECLDRAMRELQLDAEYPDRLGWADFKSFFVYLVQSPLRQLHLIICQPLTEMNLDFEKAAYIPNLPLGLAREELDAGFASIGVSPSKTFVSPNKEGNSAVAVVFFGDIQQISKALQAQGHEFLGRTLVIDPYTTQKFPGYLQRADNNPSIVAHALATTVLFGRVVGEKVDELDKQMKVTASLKKFDEENQISVKTKQAVVVAGNAFAQFDEQTGLSIKANQVKDQLMQNESISKGVSFLSGFFANVSANVNQLKSETREVLAVQERKVAPDEAAIVSPGASSSVVVGNPVQPAAVPAPSVQPTPAVASDYPGEEEDPFQD